MNIPLQIELLKNTMFEFQKLNNIKDECFTNSQYCFDFINYNFNNLKPRVSPMICIVEDTNKNSITFINHCVVLIENHIIIDPSYDVYKRNPLYFDNVKDLFEMYNDISFEHRKELIQNNLLFYTLAKNINRGEVLVTSKDYYNKQADYVENTIHKFIL